ncbi:MAG: 23S rRNA (uracil-5-)-methyltransferase RumA [Candidatus Parcubacteria bacterium]|nr:MAG: 23S rRNA (uracil-5-)-methyltransferase RumA [Candidatus Parcubacteria bacterium]
MIKNFQEVIIDFEKIGHNGTTIGRVNNKIVFSYGVLPGERVKIKICQDKKNFLKGEPIEIIKPSHFRIEPLENHYLSCSPWQVFDYNFQVELKKNILEEIFVEFAQQRLNLDYFYSAKDIFEYRTKIEYSFLEENNNYFLAFYRRDNFREKIKLESGCLLMDKEANLVSLDILEKINKNKLKNLKSLIIRKTRKTDDIHFSLLTTDNKQNFIYKNDKISGFVFAYTDPKSPASKFDEILNSWGKGHLEEKILDLLILYPYDSFFQNNIELFEEVLKIIRHNSQEFNKVVDLYSGVGVIGLSLKDKAKNIFAIDFDKKAIDYSKLNAEINGVKNFKSFALASEKIPLTILDRVDLLILDPPRAGLHKKLINLIIKTKPNNIFYLSCNPITQARDIFYLKDFYLIDKLYAFDFYPQTPHLESLAILKRK